MIIFDEAHNIFGSTTASIVEDIGKDKVVIGFTATPDANEKKRLEDHLPVKIHDLTFKEASDMELVAPVASIGLRSRSKVQGSDLFTSEGEYQDDRLGHLAGSSSRNQLIANTAKTLVEHGFGTLVPCIAGAGARHARVLADMLSGMGVSAAAIHGDTPPRQRERFLEQFDAGEIDVLTNIRVLREGYDSTRAKAIIEAGLTRSMIIKRQRIGRVLRPGDIAVVVDVLDDYDRNNPPLHLPDILDGQDLAAGEIYGPATIEQRQRIARLVAALGESAVVADKTPADYSRLFDTLGEYQQIVSGKIRSHKRGHYSVPEKISPKYSGVNDEIITKLWQMHNEEPDAVLGRQNFTIRALYNVGHSVQLLREIPHCEKTRIYVEKNERWLSAEGIALGFARKYPDVDADLVEERVQELGDKVDWRPLKALPPKSLSHRAVEAEVYKAYQADKDTIAIIDKQLKDYFEIVTKAMRSRV